ncbi:MAG: hypothetical protein JWR02_1467 [Mucilaginibacter sp.]|nr:hypothetical protein [Mucilaginibacter sp.]
MKTSRIITIAILSGLLLSASCKKHVVQPVNQLSLLPPATQTGARTFGCLVNGKAFVPENRSIIEGPDMQCNYILLNGGYYFTLALSNNDNGLVKGMWVKTDSLAIAQGQTYKLITYAMGDADASYYLLGNDNRSYITNTTVSGVLTITKLDPATQIVSGTFYFKAVNAPGDTVSVTDGRFDMPYTR